MSYQSETSPSSRFVGIGLVIALHLAIIYALATGLATTMVEVIKGPIQVETLTEQQDQKEAPPPPPPQTLKPPPVYVPPPDINIQTEAPSNSTAIQAVTSTHTNPKIALPPPEYPAAARRLKAEGKVVLQVDVDERGRISNVQFVRTEDMTVNDPAVIEEFKKTATDMLQGQRVKPATNGGVPVAQSAFLVKITFRCKVGGENYCN